VPLLTSLSFREMIDYLFLGYKQESSFQTIQIRSDFIINGDEHPTKNIIMI